MENNENQEVDNIESQNPEPLETKPAVEITSKYLKSTTRISGWLVFFLFAIMLGGFIGLIKAILAFDLSEAGGSYLIAFSDIFLTAMCFFLASYTLYAFSNRLPNAVFLGKNYVVATFVINILHVCGINSGLHRIFFSVFLKFTNMIVYFWLSHCAYRVMFLSPSVNPAAYCAST